MNRTGNLPIIKRGDDQVARLRSPAFTENFGGLRRSLGGGGSRLFRRVSIARLCATATFTTGC